MTLLAKPLWGEGLFLRPQHFQLQDHAHDLALQRVRQLARLYPWGLAQLQLEAEALKLQLVRVSRVRAVFQDGATVDAPGNAGLPPARSLSEVSGLGQDTLVYLGIALHNSQGENCSRDTVANRPVRFQLKDLPQPDWYTDSSEAEMTVLDYQLRVFFSPENRDGYYCMPVARLEKNALGEWQQDMTFMPPMLEIGACDELQMRLNRLLDILAVKQQMLSARLRERSHQVAEYGPGDVGSFWLLHAVSQGFPLLRHYAQHPAASPEDLYLVLIQLAGQLLTFSTGRSLTDLPVYQHADPAKCFAVVDDLIRELLDTVVSQRSVPIALTELKPSFHTGHLNDERLLTEADFYLSVSADLPAAELIERVPVKFKLGAPDDVEKIVNSALPGVQLVYQGHPPSALPTRVGNLYFSLEPRGQIFERMLKARSVSVYVPQGFSGLTLELIAVFR